MQLEIPKHIEASLQDRATRAGYDSIEAYALSLLDSAKGDAPDNEPSNLTGEQWQAKFRAFVARHQPTGHSLHDRRECMYD